MQSGWRLVGICVGLFSVGLLIASLTLSPEFVERHLSPDGSLTRETVAMVSLWRVVLFCVAVVMMGLWIAKKPLIRLFWRYAIHRGRTPPESLSVRDLMGTPGLGRLGTALWLALPIWLIVVDVSFVRRIQWPRFLLGEYGVFESATALLYLFAGVFGFVVAFRRRADGMPPGFHRGWMLLLGAFCIFIAGEEVNWGQLYFQFDTPAVFSEANYQDEVSLHNVRLPECFPLGQMYWANDICIWIALAGVAAPWLLVAGKRLRLFTWTWEIPIPPLLAQGYFAAGFLMPFDSGQTVFGWQMRPSEPREFSLAVAFAVWVYGERNRWRIYVDATRSQTISGGSTIDPNVNSNAA